MKKYLFVLCLLSFTVQVEAGGYTNPVDSFHESYRAVDDMFARDREEKLRREQFEFEKQRYREQQQLYEEERQYREERKKQAALEEQKRKAAAVAEAERKWQEDQSLFFKVHQHYVLDQPRWDALNKEVMKIAREYPDKPGMNILIEAHLIIEEKMPRKDKEP